MKNKVEYFLFISFSYLFKYTGLKKARVFAKYLGLFFYYIVPIRKKTVLENLRTAFPEFSEQKIYQTAKGSYISFAVALVEIMSIPWLTQTEVEKMVECDNIDIVNIRHKEGNGVIMLSAHFGNWELIAVSVALQIKVPLSVIAKSQRNPIVNDFMNNIRTKWNNKVVSLGVSIRHIYKELLDKKIVAMIADQRGPREGQRVNFFGKPTAIYPGPAMLALKTGAPILYGIAIRQPDGNYKTHLEEISKDNLTGSDEEKIAEISARHMKHLENTIRQHPEQWLWHHKVWKY